MDKLFIVVRKDLGPGSMCAQACHALRAFVENHPEIDKKWFKESNNLVILEVADMHELRRLQARVKTAGFAYATFLEPDFDNMPTAMTVEPGAWRLLSSLPLALKQKAA